MVGLLKGKIDLVVLVAVSVIDRIEDVIYLKGNSNYRSSISRLLLITFR